MPRGRTPGRLWALGPCVSVACSVLRASNITLAGALTRLTGDREAQLPGFCAWLFGMQATSSWLDGTASQYAEQLAVHTTWSEETYAGIAQWEEDHYLDPHEKLALRKEAMEIMMTEGKIIDSRVTKHGVEGKLKLEVAKFGKYGRLTVDLLVPASLLGAWGTKFIKEMMANTPYESSTMRARFVPSASDDDLRRIFSDLRFPKHRYEFGYFSDDSVLAMTIGGVTTYMDIDISSCDKSHGFRVFRCLKLITPPHLHRCLDLLVEQLTSRIQIRDVNNRQRKLILKPTEPFLYSGSTLTTIVNNVANLMIAWSIDRMQPDTPEGVVIAARDVGYIVTTKVHKRWEQLQFLKHSPVMTPSGDIAPVVNLGVFFRALGITRVRDLNLTVEEQSAGLVLGLIDSLYPTYRPSSLQTMRNRFSQWTRVGRAAPTLTQLPYLARSKTQGPLQILDDHAVLERYQLSSSPTLSDLAHSSVPGSSHHGEDSQLILTQDYDLTANPFDSEEFPHRTAPFPASWK